MFIVVRMKTVKRILVTAIILVLVVGSPIYAFSLRFPLRYLDLIEENAVKYGLETALVCAVIHAESKFEKGALSSKGASGLMQIIENTADWAATEIGMNNYSYDKIFEPKINLEIGCWYLKRQLNLYDGNIETALASYNAGSGNVRKWLDDARYSSDGKNLDVIPFKETENYVRRVKRNHKIYSILLHIMN